MPKSNKAKRKHPEINMEDHMMMSTFSLIVQGSNLAKELEANLGNLANHPEILSKSCDDIVKVFAAAKERLINAQETSTQQQQSNADPSLQEWLKYGGTSVIRQAAMDMIQHQLLVGNKTPPSQVNEMLKGSVGGEFQTTMDVSESGRGGGASSSSQRPRKRSETCVHFLNVVHIYRNS